MKRCLDLVLACIGLLLVLPLSFVIGLFIKLDSRGPILYRCDRIGKDGKPFKMYKFRTMFHNADPELHRSANGAAPRPSASASLPT